MRVRLRYRVFLIYNVPDSIVADEFVFHLFPDKMSVNRAWPRFTLVNPGNP